MLPREFDRLSAQQREIFVSDGEGILEPELERHIIGTAEEWVIDGGITAGRFSTEGLGLIAQRFPGPGGLAEMASCRENSPLDLMADASMLMLLERGVRSFCRRMGRPERAEEIITAYFGRIETTVTLRDVWGEPLVVPDEEK